MSANRPSPAEDSPGLLEAARRVLAERYPDAAAFAAPDGTKDGVELAVILEGRTLARARRETARMGGARIEIFMHDEGTCDYHLSQEAQAGFPALALLLASGAELPGPNAFSRARKARALSILSIGPPALDALERERRRYAITVLLDEIASGPRREEPAMLALARLYEELADFRLRTTGRWSGRGRALLRALHETDAALAARYEDVFLRAFALEGSGEVLALAAEILTPHGGRFWEATDG